MTRLCEILAERVIVFDGAMGTSIQSRDLSIDDFGGPHFEGCNENLVLTRPDVIEDIHSSFLAAGADVVETNTFGATPLVLAEYGIADQTLAINRAAARIARSAADSHTTEQRPRFVAGSMGPTTKTISVTGGVTFQELTDSFAIQARGLMEGGVDVLLLETAQDTLNVKAAAIGIRQAQREFGSDIPLMVSATIEPMGTTLAGQGVEALYASCEHLGLLSIGLNCATGPQFMTDHIRSLAALSTGYISCLPNAGLPDEEGRYNERPETVADVLARFAREGLVNIVGGCCGTTPEHIAAMAQAVEGIAPRVPQCRSRHFVSGIDFLEMTDENRPLLVGERTNVIGSRKFKRLICEGDYEEASEIGRRQVRSGAQIIDVCLANPDRDERADIEAFLPLLARKIKAPVMIDSTDPEVIERALQFCQGKSLINSINLEEGEERFEQIVPMAQRYGAALVVGCIDDDPEQGMAVTVERKLEVARRSYELLTKKYGVPPRDILFDALVFPCATGDEGYIGSARSTIEGVRAIREAFPESRTILGVSNVSFGLPPAGREVVNSVFLYHCTKAGLDMAIVNTEKLGRYASIPEAERALAEDLLYDRGDDPITPFVAFYRGKKSEEKVVVRPESVEERLQQYIIEGRKDGLLEDLQLALQTYAPLAVINGPLSDGMATVGKLFNANELIVTEVLQSAEVMKAAVNFLESKMEKSESSKKASILLATVKGDVHDIGKNLVDMILTNNGYRVVNLGIKIPPERLIDEQEKHRADLIGLSGLLVKSAGQMVVTVQDLRTAGIHVPILVGGAALSNRFTRTKIAPAYDGPVVYAKDAMRGLDIANQLTDPQRREAFLSSLASSEQTLDTKKAKRETVQMPESVTMKRALPEIQDCPTPPDLKRHVFKDYPLFDVFTHLNLQMLLGKHLGLKGNVKRLLEEGDEKAKDLKRQLIRMEDEVIQKKLFRAKAVMEFFPTYSVGNTQYILDPAREKVIAEIEFPRQPKEGGLCAADFLASKESGIEDNVGMFVVSCGAEGFLDKVAEFREAGEYVKAHMLQALCLESAEACAELIHEKFRDMWGLSDDPGMTLEDKLKAKYRGIRLSFGYPACPRLEDQRILFDLLRPEEIDCQLTEEYMMDPEASVSAIVYHHPDARYFSVGAGIE